MESGDTESWQHQLRVALCESGICMDCGKLIGDVPSATAILDRFLHHAEMITITGKSYLILGSERI